MKQHTLLIFWLGVKISKNEKSGIPKSPNRTFLEVSSKMAENG
jgi:hypothetical protein